MSAPGQGFTGERQPEDVTGSARMQLPNIQLSEEERAVMLECRQESFWYRSLPLAGISMALTARFTRGSTKPLPKVLLAGLFGYMAGKISYVTTCAEKFNRLKDSPFAEALRQQQRQLRPPQPAQGQLSEMGDTDASTRSLQSMFQSDTQSQTPAQSRDYDYGYSQDAPIQVEQDLSVPEQPYVDEERPKQKHMSYEDLRLKNRQNYEVSMTQKAETLMKPAPQRESQMPKTEVKKNIYGDAWDE